MQPVHRSAIHLQLRELSQLFNSLDPSPFHDRDLDADAEEFIVSWARELPGAHELELVVHLSVAPTVSPAQVAEAVHHYFASRVELKRRELRQLFRVGRRALAIGTAFLIACLTASELLPVARGAAASVIEESLIIVGWVAMWRPLEIYLYDWWPLKRERRVLERLARMEVKIESRAA